jgi:hypothetical protein
MAGLTLGLIAAPAAADPAVPLVPLPAGWSVRLLPTPDQTTSRALGINDRGLVVGWSQRRVEDATVLAPTLWRPGEGPTYLPLPPGFRHGQTFRITSQGSVLGQCWNDPNPPHPLT